MFFFGHATVVESQRPKRHRQNAPLITSPAADEPRRPHTIIGRGRDSDQGPGTSLSAAAWAAQSRLGAHAQRMAGCCQIGGCDRVGLDVTRAFLPTTREWRTAASLHGCTPRRAKLRTGSFSDARMWRRGCLAITIVNHSPCCSSCAPVQPPRLRPLYRQALRGAVCLPGAQPFGEAVSGAAARSRRTVAV